VERIDSEGVVLLLGGKEAWTRLTWECLEGVVPFLRERGEIPIGGQHVVEPELGTLDEYLKGCMKRNTARWVASLLEAAGVVTITRDRPATIRLR
jgi:hypothetical protein